jgi:hypothetical protein
VRRFFKIRNLTRRVERLLPKLTFLFGRNFAYSLMPNPPRIPVGPHCTNPITCEFFDRCNPPLPNDHIGYLPRLHASAAEELEEMGVESILDIPKISAHRATADCVHSVQTGEPWFSAELGKELESLKYPLYFMDFESVNPAIPRFSGMRPFDQLPFQWSLHVQREPGSELEHYEFLGDDGGDPRREFITSLCGALGESGSIVVYAAFESQRLSELAAWLPEFAGRIKKIQRRLWDLLPVSEPRLPSPVCRIVLAEVRAACAGARYDLRRHGGREMAGRWAGLGVAHTRRPGSNRAGQDQEGAPRLLRTGHAGAGQARRKAPVDLN